MLIGFERLLDLGVEPSAVLHVGAHLVEEAEGYASHGFSPVWWVEGNPGLALQITERLANYPDQSCAFALVSSEPREVMFHVANNGQSSSILEFGTHAREHPEVHYIAHRKMRTTTIDRLATLGVIGRASFMNLDVQGAELDVLKGAEKYLATVSAIYSEVNESELYLGCALLPQMDAWLGERGFVRVALEMTPHGWGDAVWRRR